MVISTIADEITRSVENVTDSINEALFEPVVRLGVTGLSRAGKTVFITSLVANLLDRGRMPGLLAAADGRITAAFLQPQPDDTVPRFEYEAHLSAMTGSKPHWPESTRAVSELRLSLRVRPTGLLAGLQGPRTVHLDIVDYPGEWLLDLGLMDKSYAQWSADVLDRIKDRTQAKAYLKLVDKTDAKATFEDPQAQDLAAAFTEYLNKAREDGFYDCTPGRFLLPGDLAGSPALTFAPLPGDGAGRRSLYGEMARRYEAYKSQVIRPFFRDHFARIDRQVVLVDMLGALHHGPGAVEDLRRAMTDILQAFRPGTNNFLSSLFGGRRVEKILFAATKADHVHHQQHKELQAVMSALTRDAKDRADFAGSETASMAIASLRATVEEMRKHQGSELPCVRGRLDGGKEAAFYPGDLPADPAEILSTARDGAKKWLNDEFQAMQFQPAKLTLSEGDGPPHIRLDRAAEFLIGDRL